MGLTLQRGQKLFVDTAPFIYFMEGEGPRADKVADLLEQSTRSGALWVTSLVTYMELRVLPERKGLHVLAAKYRDFLTNSEQVSIHPMDLSVADVAVSLRARHGLKIADALQLAVARLCGADYVITNDREWGRVSEAKVVCVDDL